MRTPDSSAWLTATDLARELGVCRETVQKAITAGQLPGIRIGAQYRISVAMWDAFKRGDFRPEPKGAPAPKPVDLIRRKAGAA